MRNHQHQITLEHLNSLSNFLDNAIPIPGTPYRIGIDPIIGLFPGVGDYVGAAFSSYILLQGARLGVPRATLLQMMFNILLEMIVGTIPVVGDLFDFAWKANVKNLALIEGYIHFPDRQSKANWGFVGLLIGGIVLILIPITVLSVWLLKALVGLFT